MTVDEEYALSSGLPLDGAKGKITAMEFGFNAAIGAGVLCANLTITNVEDGTETEQSFSVGDGWESRDKGARIDTADGKPRKLSNRTNWGRLVESAVKTAGGPEKMPAPSPKSSEGWVGSVWTFGTVKVKTTNPNTGVEKEKDAVVITAFHGADSPAAGSGAAKASGSTTKASGTKKATLETADADLWASLLELAGEYDEHAAFMAAALERDDVDGNALATNAVCSVKAGSVWAAKLAG